jgi:hypothetical protein
MYILVGNKGEEVIGHASIGIISPSVNKGLKVLAILHLGLIFSPQIPIPLGLRGIELGKVPEATSENITRYGPNYPL